MPAAAGSRNGDKLWKWTPDFQGIEMGPNTSEFPLTADE